jgi:2-oxoglutarate ferredoxin oxidoreductase subunit alpha
MQTIGKVLCRVIQKAGLDLFAHMDYMSRIRGGNNFFQVRISDTPCFAPRRVTDIVVALDKRSVWDHREGLQENGVLVLDKTLYGIEDDDTRFLDVPLQAMSEQQGNKTLFINAVACGVIAGMLRIDKEVVADVLGRAFEAKGEDVVRKNREAAEAGYSHAIEHVSSDRFQVPATKPKHQPLMNGNEAIALGAIHAGCTVYSAYPMTPSTSVMNTIAHFAHRYGILVEQAEDELAAINMVVGASFAGARAMTGTSGGGIALMSEGISLAAMTETPVVIVDSQRPAPATGFPTRTEQADLDLVINAGHGEFAKVVYAPGSIQEAAILTVKAFDVAQRFQIPVLILTDQFLADAMRNCDFPDLEPLARQSHVIARGENTKDYRRYALTESGISPRAVPGWSETPVYADSDEHTEEGHITEDATVRTRMVEKRFHKKMQALEKHVHPPTVYNGTNADILLIGWGSTLGVLHETVQALTGTAAAGYIHLPQVWPFPAHAVKETLAENKKAMLISVENNAAGQCAGLLRRQTGIEVDEKICKYDGRPFTVEEVAETVMHLYTKD